MRTRVMRSVLLRVGDSARPPHGACRAGAAGRSGAVAEGRGDLVRRLDRQRRHRLDLLQGVLEGERRDAEAVPGRSPCGRGSARPRTRRRARSPRGRARSRGVGRPRSPRAGRSSVVIVCSVRWASPARATRRSSAVVREAAQDDLADPRRVQREGEADPRRHLVRLVGVGADQVDDLVAVDGTDVDGAVRRRRRGRRRTAARSRRCRSVQRPAGERQDLRPRQVRAVRRDGDELGLHEGGQDAVRRGLRQTRSPRPRR